jgi:peroxiredoxin
MTRHRGRPWVLGLLIALSAVTLVMAAWQWQQDRRLIAQQSKPTPLEGDSPAPEFTLKMPDGTPVSLSDFRGKVVLLNFWATWCPPCTMEMPELDALYRRYGDTNGLVVVGVDLEEPPQEVASFAEQKNITFPLLVDPNGRVIQEDYGIRTLPASVIIDREGRIRDRWTGTLQLEAMLTRLGNVW